MIRRHLSAQGAPPTIRELREGLSLKSLRGVTIHLALKSEQAVLKGVGATVVAEAEIPPLLIADPEIRLAEFLAGGASA